MMRFIVPFVLDITVISYVKLKKIPPVVNTTCKSAKTIFLDSDCYVPKYENILLSKGVSSLPLQTTKISWCSKVSLMLFFVKINFQKTPWIPAMRKIHALKLHTKLLLSIVNPTDIKSYKNSDPWVNMFFDFLLIFT